MKKLILIGIVVLFLSAFVFVRVQATVQSTLAATKNPFFSSPKEEQNNSELLSELELQGEAAVDQAIEEELQAMEEELSKWESSSLDVDQLSDEALGL